MRMLRERLGSQVCELRLARRHFPFDYPFPPSDVVNFFRLYYGPVNRAFASLDRAGRRSLHQELEADLVGEQSWAGRVHADSFHTSR